MNVAALGLLLVSTLAAAPLHAGTRTLELDSTMGYTSEGRTAASSQVRLFGEFSGATRYFVEASWADRLPKSEESDAFSAAYPYDNRVLFMESYLERDFSKGGQVGGLRLGRFRSPFGIFNRGDQAYTGFLRPPLIRRGQDAAVSNYWLEGGVDVYYGKPRLFAEVSLGVPTEGADKRREGLDRVYRVQGYHGDWIVGASHIATQASHSPYPFGRARFNGVDARWMRAGIQLRGEWIAGRPFPAARSYGEYVDLLVHRLSMGSVTAVARYETLTFRATAPDGFVARRWTLGLRAPVARSLIGEINVIRQPGLTHRGATALDLGFTYTVRR